MPTASERTCNTVKCFNDFGLEAKAGTWPYVPCSLDSGTRVRLSYLAHQRPDSNKIAFSQPPCSVPKVAGIRRLVVQNNGLDEEDLLPLRFTRQRCRHSDNPQEAFSPSESEAWTRLLGTNEPVKARFWLWFEPFSVQKSSKSISVAPFLLDSGYMGTSPIRNCFLIRPYGRTMPRALRWS